jgi:hypothetical protein
LRRLKTEKHSVLRSVDALVINSQGIRFPLGEKLATDASRNRLGGSSLSIMLRWLCGVQRPQQHLYPKGNGPTTYQERKSRDKRAQSRRYWSNCEAFENRRESQAHLIGLRSMRKGFEVIAEACQAYDIQGHSREILMDVDL